MYDQITSAETKFMNYAFTYITATWRSPMTTVFHGVQTTRSQAQVSLSRKVENNTMHWSSYNMSAVIRIVIALSTKQLQKIVS